MSIKSFILIIITLTLFTSCEKEEKAYVLPPLSKATLQMVNMGTDYSKVIFYNLNTESFTVEELGNWDLALEATADGFRALINGGFGVQVAHTGDTNFSKVYDEKLADWKWDSPSLTLDSTAIGNWSSSDFIPSKQVYIVDRGERNNLQRYVKMQLVEVNATLYQIRIASLDGSNEYVHQVNKNPNVSFVYLHFNNGPLELFEPPKEEWDFMFTRYRFVYYDMEPIVPYEVNGVILNPNNVTVAETRMDWDSVTFDNTSGLNFSSKRDFIGFDWKTYDFSKEAYITDINRILIIKSHSGKYFKLRFIDFYDELGVKGAPSFEFLRLN